jgi:hypothetical protein
MGKGPISYVELAEKIQVPISLLDLMQISPDLSKAFRKISTRVNEKKSKASREESRTATPENREDSSNNCLQVLGYLPSRS